MYLIKDLEMLGIHPTLIQIWDDLDAIAGPGMITSAYRPGDPGVHGHFRGLDRRCRNKALGNAMKEYINSRWIYDPDRPDMQVAVAHETVDKETGKKKGFHIHLQAHNNTRRR
jgi:hypothetical protein